MGKKIFIPPQQIFEGNGVVFKNFTINNLCKLISVYFILIEFLFKFFFQNVDQLLIKFHEILTVFFLHEHLRRKSTFFL